MLAVARILFPKTIIALAAGRNEMSEEMQALCIFAGANAMHVGEKLLVTPLPNIDKDNQFLAKLGINSVKL
jgi:biotin synthase